MTKGGSERVGGSTITSDAQTENRILPRSKYLRRVTYDARALAVADSRLNTSSAKDLTTLKGASSLSSTHHSTAELIGDSPHHIYS